MTAAISGMPVLGNMSVEVRDPPLKTKPGNYTDIQVTPSPILRISFELLPIRAKSEAERCQVVY